MELSEFLEELELFRESRAFLTIDDDDKDEYRQGYRKGYYDALLYIVEWVEELID